MEPEELRVAHAIEQTKVLRSPRLALATFGTTRINYHLLTTPIYAEADMPVNETVVREGKVISERPRVITPSYLINLEGFSENARKYLEMVRNQYGPHAPGLFYSYRNEAKQLSIVSNDIQSVTEHLMQQVDKANDPLATIISGVDDLWDVSLMKFIHEFTSGSLESNVKDLSLHGLLDIDRSGVPRDARVSIEEMFEQVRRGEADPSMLKQELDRWGLFDEYEDRFLNLFKRRP